MELGQIYVLVAAEGREGALAEALAVLAGKVSKVAGCVEVSVLQDSALAGRFVFIEKWLSAEARDEGGKVLGREAFADVMGCIGAKPERSLMRYLPVA